MTIIYNDYLYLINRKRFKKTMNSKMTTNPQLSTTEPKKMKTKTKQTTRIGTESEKWTSHRVFSVGSGRGRMGVKV